MNNSNITIGKQQPVLQDYYGRYLKEIRGVSDSSVKHYFEALRYISKKLKEMGHLKQDVYEIADLEELERLRTILYADEDFIALNERGKRMYSAGLNNYFRFACGEDFKNAHAAIQKLDVPIAPESAVVVSHTTWKRSGILRTQSLELAGYSCEFDSSHRSFVAENTNKPYMEAHHAMPMNLQPSFPVSLDVYANIVCLCPVCHRQIHHGLKQDRTEMVKRIYDTRGERLAHSGIVLSKDEFVSTILQA